jgi:ABC-type Fe3+-hydroxamate transport system substrate-binding protein
MQYVDAMGNAHAPVSAGTAPRIVSLVPSLTALLCDLGLAQFLVGRTGFCIHPKEAVQAIEKVGGTKDVNIDKIRALAPTHLVVNIDENEKPTVELLAQFVPHVIVTHPLLVRDNLALYRLFGGIFQVVDKAEALCAAFEHEFAALAAVPKSAQSVLYCIWKDPWMTVGRETYIADMLRLINWQVWTPSDATERYPRFVWSEQLRQDVDRVLLSTEPYRFTEQHADSLEKQIGIPVQLVDGEMMSWYGSHAIAGLRYLGLLTRGF